MWIAILLLIACSRKEANAPPAPVYVDNIFPVAMVIDYVRYFKMKE